MSTDYRAPLRAHVAKHGVPVTESTSAYADWDDYEAGLHAGGFRHSWNAAAEPAPPCSWVVPKGAMLTETTEKEWGGTFGDDLTFYVVDVAGCRCACGLLQNRTLRLVSTFGDVLRAALGDEGASIPL